MVGIAISGLGEVSQNHYRGILYTEYGELVGVFSHSKERAEKIAKLWNTKPYHSYDEMLKDEKVDSVVICSADEHHYEQAIKAMKAGKHVLVEKPLSLSLKEVIDMARVSKEENVTLFPVHNYIFRPKVMRAKKLIQDKEIGEPTYALFIVTQRMEENVAKKYHGALFTQAYHSIYVSNYLLGLPKEIYASWSTITYKELKSDEIFVSTFKYANGGIGNIVANWAADDISSDSWMWLDKIVGTKGVITISSFGDVSYQEGVSFMMAWTVDYRESFINLMKHFVDDVLARKRKPIQTVYDAILVHDIMEKLRFSAEEGKRLVYYPPKLEGLI
ncbi:scyllo-inositol 2-dehydrogenase (NAD(+)) [Candidatus Calditenuaceae archaeon HR02]|nr:scyllo-inositol 2-dehydrogenase (NAD(+)) [Candidatus Calditenuaceae archaeon HR02]